MTENDTDTDEAQDDGEQFAETTGDDAPAASTDDTNDSTDAGTDSADTGADSTDAGADSKGQTVIRALQWAAFAILLLVALVATFQFYFAASNTINEFVARRYRPPFHMAFNLVILLGSALGLSVLVRRIA